MIRLIFTDEMQERLRRHGFTSSPSSGPSTAGSVYLRTGATAHQAICAGWDQTDAGELFALVQDGGWARADRCQFRRAQMRWRLTKR